MTRYVALLRGINLAGRRRVGMADLCALLEERRYADVRTYLQSGNVGLTADAAPEEVERDVAAAIRERFGLDVGVVVRTRDELAAIVARDPFGDIADDPRRYQVSFLSAEPDPERVRALAAEDVAPERFEIIGREAYAWHPNGIQRSPLAKLLSEDRLGVGATARNWRTVQALLDLAGS